MAHREAVGKLGSPALAVSAKDAGDVGVTDDRTETLSVAVRIKRAQSRVKKYFREGESLVDMLFADRA